MGRNFLYNSNGKRQHLNFNMEREEYVILKPVVDYNIIHNP